MSQINFCSQCGAPLSDANANFCSKCGYKFKRTDEVTAPTVETPVESVNGLIKNTLYAKYSRNLGIVGLAISSILCLMLTIRLFTIWDGYDCIETSALSFNSALFNVGENYSYFSFNKLLVVAFPILLSFIAC